MVCVCVCECVHNINRLTNIKNNTSYLHYPNVNGEYFLFALLSDCLTSFYISHSWGIEDIQKDIQMKKLKSTTYS